MKKLYFYFLVLLLLFSAACSDAGSLSDAATFRMPHERTSLISQDNTVVKDHEKAPAKASDIALLEGSWVHEEDSAAYILVQDSIWMFGYKNQAVSSDNTYILHIVDQLTGFVAPGVEAKFLVLTNKTDTMHYEISGLNSETLSLIWYPAGRLHVYKRKH